MRPSIKHAGVAAIVALLVIFPPVVGWWREGIVAVFRYAAADMFYYLSVARHSAHASFYTFDTIHPTNGFHPLWQYIITGAFDLFGIVGSQEAQLQLVFWSSVALVALGAGLCALALLRMTGRALLVIAGLVPGFYYLLFDSLSPQFGSTWSFINGLETPLSIALFGLLLYMLANRELLLNVSYRSVVTISTLVTLLTLSRLDDIFLFAPFLLWIIWRPMTWSVRGRYLAVASVIPVLCIGGYMLYNLSYAGLLVPVSGIVKGGWAFGATLQGVIQLLVPYRAFEGSGWADISMRIVQMMVPLLVAIAWLMWLWMRRDTRDRREELSNVLLGGLAIYVVLKGLYNILHVPLWNQGHWYFPLSIFIMNMMIVVAMHRVLLQVNTTAFNLVIGADRRVQTTRVIWGIFVLLALFFMAAGLSQVGGLATAGREYLVVRRIAILGLCGLGIAMPVAAWILVRRLRQHMERTETLHLRLLPSILSLGVVTYLIVVANSFIYWRSGTDYNFRYYQLWNHRAEISRSLHDHAGNTGLVEFDDGILCYSLDVPTMSGLGFTLDRNAAYALVRGELLDTAYQRGFRMFSSLAYQKIPDSLFEHPEQLQQYVETRTEGADRWKYSVVYADKPLRLAFVGFEPRDTVAGTEVIHHEESPGAGR